MDRTRRHRQTLILVAATMLLAVGCRTSTESPSPPTVPSQGDRRSLSGAGATFPAPIYDHWFAAFPRTGQGVGVQVRYDAVGSGKGIAAFTERRVDFGATDVPLSPDELAKAEAAGGPVMHIPTVLGAITVADVRNIAGRFVTPSPETVAEAAEDMSLASAGDFARSLLYTTGRNAYPISSYTYLLVFTRQDDPGKGRMLADLLQYMAGPGQASVVRLHYTPIPRELRESVAAKIRLLHDPNGNLLAPT